VHSNPEVEAYAWWPACHVDMKKEGTVGVSLTSSLPFSLDSAVQAFCNAFISCLFRKIIKNICYEIKVEIPG
jgi:hypothetical protein